MLALILTMLAIVACPLVWGRSTKLIATIAAVGIGAAFVLSLQVAGKVTGGGTSALSTDPTGGMLIADNLSIGFQILLWVFLAAICFLWWMGSAEQERNAPEFLILLLGSALGMALMVSTTNLLLIIVAIETASLPSYAIVGFDKKDRVAAEASLKYMIFGAVSAAIMLYGASLLYGLVGSLGVADIARFTVENLGYGQSSTVLRLGLLCFFAGIAFKISAVPFHFWCPDAFEGAKIEVTTWLSVVSKAAGLILLTRMVLVFCGAVTDDRAMALISPLAWTIGIVACITCTVGNFSAYKQESVKRMLAYSSIAHAGYMMMAAAVFLQAPGGVPHAGLSALLVYILIYMFMNLGAFGVAAMVVWQTGSDRLESFTGLIRRAPWLAVPMVICLMSLVGLPPLAGFIGKWWILVALGSLGSTLGWVLVIVAVVNTLISLYYYMRIVIQMTLRDNEAPAFQPPLSGVALVNVCAALLLAFFIWADPVRKQAGRFSQNLFEPSVRAATTADSDPDLAADQLLARQQ